MRSLTVLLLSRKFAPVVTLILFFAAAACGTRPADEQAAEALAASHAQAPSGQAGTAAETFTGSVVETMDSGGYTYARLKADDREVWIAASEMPVTEGQNLTVALNMPMAGFHSNTLDRDFELIYFVSGVALEGQSIEPPPAAPAVEALAPPEGGLAIADVWAKRASLAGKSLIVRGTVVKANNQIMGRNWFHLQDGSGVPADGTNDLTVTTDAVVSVGQVVTVTGVLAIDKDFGAGYAYGAIIEGATVK